MDGPTTTFYAQSPSQELIPIFAEPPAYIDSESAGTPTPLLDTEPQSDSDRLSTVDSIEERDVAESLLSPAASDVKSPVDEVPVTVDGGLIIEGAQIIQRPTKI
ncbi:hypothetical protein MPER_03243 [Moniliophthora perniciosa FA553]|nr:hypothetical protein MPER_03243 [Moniliophthora perniciosa FA553]